MTSCEFFVGSWVEEEVLWFDVAMNKVSLTEELESSGELPEKAAHDDFVEAS